MTVRRGSFWARLKEAGARANGLSGADAVQIGICSPDDADDGKHRANAGKDAPDDWRAGQVEGGGQDNGGGDELCGTGRKEEFEQGDVEGLGAADEWWQIWNCSGSLAATTFALFVLVVSELLNPLGPDVKRVASAAAVYGFWFASAFLAMCVLCRQGQGSFGFAVSGEFRFGAAVVAMALLWSEAPVAMSLAGWVAVAAVAMGGIADGAWLAVVSLRREVPPWRALAIVFREEKRARRELWRRLYWGGSR